MQKKRPFLLYIAFFALIGLACNAFAGSEPGFEPPPTIDADLPLDETENGPGLAPTATLPSTGEENDENGDGQPRVTTLVDLNVRSGPGVAYQVVDFLLEGSRADIIGKNEEGNWWRINCPPTSDAPECWVSAGTQFTIASNVADVAVVEAPPLPTPVPPAPESGVALLVYVDNGRLYLSRINLSQNPPTASSPIQLVDDTQVTAISIAPDGRRVAYLNGRSGSGPNSLKTVNIDGRDERTLVNADDLDLPDDYNTADWELQLNQIQWLTNSQAIAFNTAVLNLIGPGFIHQADLMTVDLDGEIDEIYAAGLAGGTFTISPTGVLLFSRDTEIVRADFDGTTQALISFDFINTASEYIYYPTPRWTSNGSAAYVAIPSAEPFSRAPTASLWRIPASGGATQLGTISENILFSDLYWNDNGSHVAYTRIVDDTGSSEPRLMVATGSGQLGPEGLPYATDERLRLYPWSSNNQTFLFSGSDYFAIGQPQADQVTVPVPPNSRIDDGQWVTPNYYVVSLQPGSSGNWVMVSGDLLGNTTQILSTSSSERPFFQLWTP